VIERWASLYPGAALHLFHFPGSVSRERFEVRHPDQTPVPQARARGSASLRAIAIWCRHGGDRGVRLSGFDPSWSARANAGHGCVRQTPDAFHSRSHANTPMQLRLGQGATPTPQPAGDEGAGCDR